MTTYCPVCDEPVAQGRLNLGYETCCNCSTERRRKNFTVVPMHKSNYMLVTDLSLLTQLTRPGRC